ncbi:hypothetical protein GJ631_15175 [Natronomonas sp. CBA1123]|uniref:hypothetical protein n=1 Tax=Natronomonas sp. CBA1123 TaxID=2668070 RepID=UPI0012EACC5D|nr:hypothetical protein [Natronomonas sp. CBA1123]MUV87857.1 hypothetical protein [Natronomonas sp. CBA1123]
MDDDSDVLFPLFVAELLTLVVALAVVTASLLGRTALLASFSRTARLLALGFLTVELLVPAWLYYDIRKRGGDRMWLHASVMPIVNLLAVAAYISERNARED